MLELLIEMAAQNNANEITTYCMAKHNKEITASAACASKLRAARNKLELDEIRTFLAANPHYRYPGVALPNGAMRPLDVCWGRNKIYGTHTKYRC